MSKPCNMEFVNSAWVPKITSCNFGLKVNVYYVKQSLSYVNLLFDDFVIHCVEGNNYIGFCCGNSGAAGHSNSLINGRSQGNSHTLFIGYLLNSSLGIADGNSTVLFTNILLANTIGEADGGSTTSFLTSFENEFTPKFDGTYFLQKASPTELPTGNSVRSSFGWVKPVGTTSGDGQALFGYGRGGPTEFSHEYSMVMLSRNNVNDLDFWGSYLDTYGNNLNLGEWNFVGFTWDQTTLTLYVNDTSTPTVTGTSLNTVADFYRIASGFIWNSAYSSLYIGDMVDVGIWNSVLATDKINELRNAGPTDYAGLPDDLKFTETLTTVNSQARFRNLQDLQARSIEIQSLSTGGAATYNAVSFTGSNQIVISNAPTNVVTISAWVKYDSISSNGPIIVKGDNDWNSSVWDWGIWADNNNFYVTSYSSSSFCSVNHDNTSWYHLVLVRDNGSETADFYVNGNYVASSAGSNGNSFANTMYSGGVHGQYMQGAVEEIQLFDYPLSSSEINNLYNSGMGVYGSVSTLGLLAGYHLNNDLIDYSTNNNYGVWGGTPAFTTGGIASIGYQSANFTGSNRITLSSEVTNIVAVSVWVNFSSSSGFGPVIVKGNDVWASTSWDWGIFVDTNSFYAVAEPAGSPFCTIPHNNNTWYHLVLVRNDGSGNCAMYVNGVLAGSGEASDSNTFDNNVFIGGVSGAYMVGQVQEVQLFNTYPSQTLITKLYNFGLGVYGSSLPVLLGGYHLNGNTIDYSAGVNNGTWTGTAAYTTGITNSKYKSANFDGSSQIVISSAPTNVNSISIWVNSTAGSNYGAIITKGNNIWDSSVWDWGIWHDGGSTFYVAGPIGPIASYHYNFGSWYHLVVVQNDGLGSSHFYVNGSLIGSNTAATANNYNNTIYIGGTSNNLLGQITEVQLFSRALASEEITFLYNNGNGVYGSSLDSGLVGGYHLNGETIDYSSNTNNGVWGGTTQYTSGIITNGSGVEKIATSNNYTLNALTQVSIGNIVTSSGATLQITKPFLANIVTSTGANLQFGKTTESGSGIASFWNLSENSGTRHDSVGTNHLNEIDVVASFTYTTPVGRGNATTFTDTSPIASNWSWDFGDDSGSSSQSPTHAYSNLGTFTVTLRINSGAQSVSHSIVVEEPVASFTSNSQTVNLADSPTSGTWAISYNNDDTVNPLNYNIEQQDLQAALRSNWGVGTINVSRSGFEYTVDFGVHATQFGTNTIQADGSALTKGITASVTEIKKGQTLS